MLTYPPLEEVPRNKAEEDADLFSPQYFWLATNLFIELPQKQLVHVNPKLAVLQGFFPIYLPP